MAGADVGGGGESHGKKHKGRKPKRRTGIAIDMTPMVDVAFLLLTFFMLTTVFRRPQTLEIKLPPGSGKAEVQESNLMVFRVSEENQIYFAKGLDAPKKMEYAEMTTLLKEKGREQTKSIILLKLDRKAKYHMMVDMIDEFNLAKLDRYSVATLSDAEKEDLKKVK
jgi:biopolymer transport protein ExbD